MTMLKHPNAPVEIPDGSGTEPGLVFWADPTTGIYRTTSGNSTLLVVRVNGVDTLQLWNGDVDAVIALLPVTIPNGLVTAPGLVFASAGATGFYKANTLDLGVAVAGVQVGLWTADGLTIHAAKSLTVTDAAVVGLNHATLSDSTTQAISDTSAVQAITFDTNEVLDGITHSTSVNPSRIYFDSAGTYLLNFSGIADTTTANQLLHVWGRIDGTDIDRSNTIVRMATASTETTVAVSFHVTVSADSYFEFMTWGSSTNCQWLATAAQTTPTRPASPSVIATIQRIE